ncbi:hypothetical protein OOK41_02005 [Micromonospora sp. NBC_01655]|uniref:hypothetical protein n=1 Tax=Micromonospora sp. NBC_01655 TaxID=2975983 RepID=UPI00224D81DD|nr:hypothetical protein [Micromonospora sp. NBC_01655]MCX4469099.1 hypothetical protein [Micromonospora sp. NBC_01655]
MTYSERHTVRQAFGAPAVLAESEARKLLVDLCQLWRLTYGKGVSKLHEDLVECKRFFDPLARGQSLRERLSHLPKTPPTLRRALNPLGLPVIIDGGDDALLIGVEGRLLIDLLEEQLEGAEDLVVISPGRIAAAEHEALRIYRSWVLTKITQVVDLRSGRGKEVMQAIAVGVVLALLVNRSDSPEKAVVQPDPKSLEGSLIDSAVFAAAERFAHVVTGSDRRSSGEQHLKKGYGLSEARRRLAPKLAAAKRNGEVLLYIPAAYRQEVVEFLGRDLARRPALTRDKLALAFDQLTVAFRANSGNLAHQSMVFERPADTRDLRASLLSSFIRHRPEDVETMTTEGEVAIDVA